MKIASNRAYSLQMALPLLISQQRGTTSPSRGLYSLRSSSFPSSIGASAITCGWKLCRCFAFNVSTDSL